MPISSPEDEYIKVSEAAVAVLNECKLPGAYWVDFLPILKHVPAWVPGAKAKQLGVKYAPLIRRARDMGFDHVQSLKVRVPANCATQS